jgi:hypothetical protein
LQQKDFKVNADRGNLPLIIHILYLMLAATFCFFYYQKIAALADFNSVSGINAVLGFNTPKPYQFRLLVPLMLKPFLFLPLKPLLMLLNTVFVYLTVLFFFLFINRMLKNNLVNYFLAPIILFPMAWNYILLNQSFQYYDLAAVFFFTAGLYFIASENFIFFVIIFTLGLINKESAVYLIFSFLLFNYKYIFTKKIILQTVLLGVIFIIIKGAITFIFRNNAGDNFEIGYYTNVIIFSNLFHEHVFMKNLGLSFGGFYVFAILLFITGRYKFFMKEFDGRLLMITLSIIPYLIAGIYMIYFTETRVYAELIAPVTTLFIIYLATVKSLNLMPHEGGRADWQTPEKIL